MVAHLGFDLRRLLAPHGGSRRKEQIKMVSLPVRRGRRRFPVGESPTRRTLQPEATGAGMEETKCLKPLARAVTTW